MSTISEILKDLKAKPTKFDESVNLDIKTGINSSKHEENMRGNILLEHGVPSNLRVLVFAEGIAVDDATVGGPEMIEEIKQNGLASYDVCLSTPDMLMKLKDIASLLGKSGLMPNKKDGTVVEDIVTTVNYLKAGKKLLFRNDKSGHIRMRIGKSSFSAEHIADNIQSVVNQLLTQKPPKVKQLFKKVMINSTQGPSFEIPLKLLQK